MNIYLLAVTFALVVATGWSKNCPNSSSNSKKSNSNKLICYYSKMSDVDSCYCSHVILPANSDIKAVEDVKRQISGVKIFVTVSEFNEGLVELLKSKKVDGVDIQLEKLSTKNDISDFISTVNTKIVSELDIFLSVPAKAEILAKYFDFKALSKHVDAFILEIAFLGVSKNVTFHPSRLSGLWDMQNTDSVVDLVTGMGAPLSKLVITAPVQGFQFTLQNEEFTAPGSPALELKSITRDELCEVMNHSGKNWTLERDDDQAGPYIFSKNQWIAFEDSKSIDIKAKYARVRGLAGMALKDVSLDSSANCDEAILQAAFNGLSRQARAPRGAVLHSLEREILETPIKHSGSVNISPFRISRIVDTEGHIHAVRQDTRTEFHCSRQGYFVHPRSCNRFYRCVKFDQLVDDYNVFEFDCPAGLAFDERVEVCVWPGSLPHGTACAGSSEIAPVPNEKFECPSDPGYYADPENCRWFFACLDHGQSKLAAYEFRCPFGLVFDGEKLLCEWPWLVQKCAGGLGIELETRYIYGGPSSSGSSDSGVILNRYNGLGVLETVKLGGIAGHIEKPVARMYSNAGLYSGSTLVNGYQNNNGYNGGKGLSYQAVQGLQNSGLLTINHGAAVVQPYQEHAAGVVDYGNIQHYNQGLENTGHKVINNNDGHLNLQNTVRSGQQNYNFYYNDANSNIHIGTGIPKVNENDRYAAVSTHSFRQELETKGLRSLNENQPVQYVTTSQKLTPVAVTSFQPDNVNVLSGSDQHRLGFANGGAAGLYQYGFTETSQPEIQRNTGSDGSASTKSGESESFQKAYKTQNKNEFDYAVNYNDKPSSLTKNTAKLETYDHHAIFRTNSDQSEGTVYQSTAPIYQSTTPIYQSEASTSGVFASTEGAVSSSSISQYHSTNQNYGEGTAGDINIIGGGFSAVGVSNVEINSNGEQATFRPVLFSTTVPTVTKIPVPGIKTATSFQTYEGGVIANTPELQYKVQSDGDYGLRNFSTKFVNYVSTTPSPLYINNGLKYSDTVTSIPVVQSATESTGYVYNKPSISFETPGNTVKQKPQGYVYDKPTISTKLEPQGYTYEKPNIVFEERPIIVEKQQQGYVYEKPKIPTKSTNNLKISTYSDVVSTAIPVENVYVSSTVSPSTTNNQPNQQNIHQGYVYNKPSVRFIEGRTETVTANPIVQVSQPTLSTYLLDNVGTSVNQEVQEKYQPHLEIQHQAQVEPHIQVQTHIPIKPQIQVKTKIQPQPQLYIQPTVHNQINTQRVERPHEPEIISRFSIRKPVEQGYYYEKPLHVAQPVLYQQEHEQQIHYQEIAKIEEPKVAQKGYYYEKPQQPLQNVQPVIYQQQHQQEIYHNEFKGLDQPKVDFGYEYRKPEVRFDEQPVVKPAILQTENPLLLNKIDQPNAVEFYQQPIIESPRPFIPHIQQVTVQHPVIEYNQRTNIHHATEQTIVAQPGHRTIVEPSPQSIIKDFPPQTIYHQQQNIQTQVFEKKEEPQVSSPRPIYTYMEQPKLPVAQNEYSPYTYQNIAQHAVAVKTQFPNIQSSTYKPVVANTYSDNSFSEVSAPKYEPVTVKSSAGYVYPRPAVTFEEERQPVEEVPFVKKTAYITGHNVETGYRYQKPAVAFEPVPSVNENYQISNYEMVRQKVFGIKLDVSTSTARPVYESTPETYTTVLAPTIPTYVEPTSRHVLKYNQVETQRKNKIGYAYPKPAIKFEEGAKIIENYQFPQYEKVKQTLFETTTKPTFYSTVSADVQKQLQPISTRQELYTPSKNRSRTYYTTTTTEKYPSNYERVRYQKIPSTTPCDHDVSTTSNPIVRYSFSSLDNKYQDGIAQYGERQIPLKIEQESERGYIYPKPTVSFEEGDKVIENYKSPQYGQVKEVFNPSPGPTLRTTFEPITVNQEGAARYGEKHFSVKIQQESGPGYVYPRPTVSFREGDKVIENYKSPQYRQVKEQVFGTSPGPTIRTTFEPITVNQEGAARYGEKQFSVKLQQESEPGYLYPRPTVSFEERVTTNKPIITYNNYNSYIPSSSTTPLPKPNVVEEYVAPEVTTLSRDYLPIKTRRPTTNKSPVVEITTLRPRGRFSTIQPEVTSLSRDYLPIRSRVKIAPTTENNLRVENKAEYGSRKLGPSRTIVKQNDYHPMLSAKLGAQCLCVSDSLRLTNNRGKKLKIVVVDQDEDEDSDQDENDDGYVVESDLKGKIVESYSYQPDNTSEVTPTPEVFIKSTTGAVTYIPSTTTTKLNNIIRGRPLSTTTELYSTPEISYNIYGRRNEVASPRSRTRSREEGDNNLVSDAEIAKAVRTGLKLVKEAAKDGAKEGTEEAINKSFDRYGPGGLRSKKERLQGTVDCQRAGLFRHPTECNKFYACRWDCNKNRFTLHVFNCPVHLTFDNNLGACNWPSQGPACVDNTLITSD